jgi:hypothetical protein
VSLRGWNEDRKEIVCIYEDRRKRLRNKRIWSLKKETDNQEVREGGQEKGEIVDEGNKRIRKDLEGGRVWQQSQQDGILHEC